MNEKKRQIATVIEDSIYEALKVKAHNAHTSVSALVREACVRAAGLNPSPMEVAALYQQLSRLQEQLAELQGLRKQESTTVIPATNQAAKEVASKETKKAVK